MCQTPASMSSGRVGAGLWWQTTQAALTKGGQVSTLSSWMEKSTWGTGLVGDAVVPSEWSPGVGGCTLKVISGTGPIWHIPGTRLVWEWGLYRQDCMERGLQGLEYKGEWFDSRLWESLMVL